MKLIKTIGRVLGMFVCLFVCLCCSNWLSCPPICTPSRSPLNTQGYSLWRTVCKSVMNDWWLHSTAAPRHPSRLHTHTYTHTYTHACRQRHTRANTFCHHTVSNSLRFASLTSTSQSLCTAAGEADTHSHTLSSPLHSHIFWKGRDEERANARQRRVFRLWGTAVESRLPGRRFGDFFPCAESSFKDFWEYHHYKRNMLDSTGLPANEN